MKKVILSAVALLAVGFANAQDLKFGAKAGLNLANLSLDYSGEGDFADNSAKVGFHVGGFVEIKFSEKFALQPELLFSTQGATSEFSENFGDGFETSYETKTALNYINLPIMVKFYPIEKLFIEAGPQIGFLMSAKDKYEGSFTEIDEEGNMTTVSESSDEDVKDLYKSIDFGFNVGVGYEFTENLFANVRYNMGLSDISEAPEGDEFDEFEDLGDLFKTRNQVFQVSLGYKF
ncbi:MAG TPA: porin family protein [Flavobacterium sp.]|jgi:hypothetical protein